MELIQIVFRESARANSVQVEFELSKGVCATGPHLRNAITMGALTLKNVVVILLPLATILACVQYQNLDHNNPAAMMYCLAPTIMNILLMMGLLWFSSHCSGGGLTDPSQFWTEEQFGTVQLPGMSGGEAEIHIKRVFKSEEIHIKRNFTVGGAGAGALVPVAPVGAGAPAASGARDRGESVYRVIHDDSAASSAIPALEYKPTGAIQPLPSGGTGGPPPSASRASLTQLPIEIEPPDMVQLPVGVAPESPGMRQLPVGMESDFYRKEEYLKQEQVRQIPVHVGGAPAAEPGGIMIPLHVSEEPAGGVVGPAGDGAGAVRDSYVEPVPVSAVGAAGPGESQATPSTHWPSTSSITHYEPMRQVPITVEGEGFSETVSVVPMYGTGPTGTDGGGGGVGPGGAAGGSAVSVDIQKLPITQGTSQTPFNLQGITIGTRLIYLSITKEAHLQGQQAQAYMEGRLQDPTGITASDIPQNLYLPGLHERLGYVNQEAQRQQALPAGSNTSGSGGGTRSSVESTYRVYHDDDSVPVGGAQGGSTGRGQAGLMFRAPMQQLPTADCSDLPHVVTSAVSSTGKCYRLGFISPISFYH